MGGLRFFERIGSTNDEAEAWAADDAPDFALVVADEQTSGRGRSGAKWFTPRGSALAFSLVLRPSESEAEHVGRMVGLGALAVAEACERSGLHAEIKWPNDVLVSGRKLAGILVESVWLGERLEATILGIGINVLEDSVPPAKALAYPATSLQTELGHPVNRLDILGQTLSSVLGWRQRLAEGEFIREWEARLAFRGKEVVTKASEGQILRGILLGLEADGSARLQTNHKTVAVRAGEMTLRPADDRMV